MVAILTWVSIFSGGVLILLMLLSIVGGWDLDIDVGSTDVDADTGGLGLVKGFLTMISVASWVMKIMMTVDHHPGFALLVGIISGLVALVILNYLFRLLLKNEENVNWEITDALFQKGTVYLKIPEGGEGIVHIRINGAFRELPAKARDRRDIPTGEAILVADIDGDYVIVETQNH